MEIDIKNLSSSIRLIQVSGEMDMYNYQELKKNFLSLSDEGIRGFIIDCENLTYIDSSGGQHTDLYVYHRKKAEQQNVDRKCQRTGTEGSGTDKTNGVSSSGGIAGLAARPVQG